MVCSVLLFGMLMYSARFCYDVLQVIVIISAAFRDFGGGRLGASGINHTNRIVDETHGAKGCFFAYSPMALDADVIKTAALMAGRPF